MLDNVKPDMGEQKRFNIDPYSNWEEDSEPVLLIPLTLADAL